MSKRKLQIKKFQDSYRSLVIDYALTEGDWTYRIVSGRISGSSIRFIRYL
eukprot:UN13373